MGSMKKADPRHAKPEEHAPSASGFWLRSFIGIALILLAVAALVAYLFTGLASENTKQRLGETSAALAEQAAAKLALVRGRLEFLREDDDLRAAFGSGQEQQLRAAETALAERFPDSLGMRLISPDQTSSVDGIPYMSYAGLDLARQAGQRGEVTPFEVHKIGQPDVHLAVAAPVVDRSGNRTLGILHLALPLGILPAPSQPAGLPATFRYRQVVGEDAAVVAPAGEIPEGKPDSTAPIQSTRLEIASWLTDTGFNPILLAQIAGAYAVILGLIGLLLWLGSRGLSQALAHDSQAFVEVVKDAVHRRPLRKVKSRLRELQEAHHEVISRLRSLQPGRAALRSSRAAPEPPSLQPESAAEDLMGPASFLNEPSVEVEEIDLPDSFELPGAEHLPEPQSAVPNPLESFDALEELASEELSQSAYEATPPPPTGAPYTGTPVAVPRSVFRAYDIRGIVERELDEDTVRAIGQAIASEALTLGDTELFIGRDCRASSPALAAALAEGIRSAGADVADLGVVPTPVVYFACNHPQPGSGAMLTASHNPAQYNGVKPVFQGQSPVSEAIQSLRGRLERGELASGGGAYASREMLAAYREYIEHDVALAHPMKLVIDCGNATASVVAPDLFRRLGCEVIELNCEIDAGFSDLIPDPAVPEQLHDLGDLVVANGANLGLAFDGDGDRLGVVDSEGRYVAADRLLMLLAADVLARNPGSDVVFDVKCSRHLAEEIRRAGGRPVMWRSGHAPLKAKIRETGALIGGELSGHLIFADRWFGFDDALYAGARLLEILSLDPRPSHEIFTALPGGIATPELALPLAEGEPDRIMGQILKLANRLDGVDVILTDGLRAEFDQGWGLVRASNTQPQLCFRFEGDNPEALEKIQALFRRLMAKVSANLELPF